MANNGVAIIIFIGVMIVLIFLIGSNKSEGMTYSVSRSNVLLSPHPHQVQLGKPCFTVEDCTSDELCLNLGHHPTGGTCVPQKIIPPLLDRADFCHFDDDCIDDSEFCLKGGVIGYPYGGICVPKR